MWRCKQISFVNWENFEKNTNDFQNKISQIRIFGFWNRLIVLFDKHLRGLFLDDIIVELRKLFRKLFNFENTKILQMILNLFCFENNDSSKSRHVLNNSTQHVFQRHNRVLLLLERGINLDLWLSNFLVQDFTKK